MKNKIYYDNQLEFKRWALNQLGTNLDIFYFDCTTGVDAYTDHDIYGLHADGTLTWTKGLSILRRHFANKLNK